MSQNIIEIQFYWTRWFKFLNYLKNEFRFTIDGSQIDLATLFQWFWLLQKYWPLVLEFLIIIFDYFYNLKEQDLWHTPEIFILGMFARLHLRRVYGEGVRSHGDAHFHPAGSWLTGRAWWLPLPGFPLLFLLVFADSAWRTILTYLGLFICLVGLLASTQVYKGISAT